MFCKHFSAIEKTSLCYPHCCSHRQKEHHQTDWYEDS